jgi:hypothetical protein
MNACIFAGPTLPPRDEARALAATWLPPAKHGDVYRAVTLLRPRAIGIVDGYFQWVPSVRHKEILWAIHQGVHVFGAASMGALRAAELNQFGMRGVGCIFEAYRYGVLAGHSNEPFEDDDEVAVVHGPAESGYLAGSEAMVNIRCTLAAAERAGVIGGPTRARLGAIAKALFFPERSYELLLERARAAGLPEAQLLALYDWLPTGRVDQKRADALAMLETMRNFLAQDPAPAAAGFAFEHTTLWERACAGARPAAVHDSEEIRVLDELRLEGARWDALRAEVLCSLMASVATQTAHAGAFLARRVADHRGEPHDIERLLEEGTRIEAARRLREEIPPAIVERQILARVRSTEDFERLRERAEDKYAQIAARADLPDVEAFSELQLLGLRDWYFSRVLGRDMPDDLESRVGAWGYADLAQFHRAIFAEYVYRQMTGAAAAGAGGY